MDSLFNLNDTDYVEEAFPDALDQLISDAALQLIFTINLVIVCASLCVSGIVTNVINIIVFSGMGFKETVNIALLGLAVSDVWSLISLLWITICMNPLFMYSDVPINTFEIQYKTGGWTHFMFTRVSAFITADVTLERCLCIALPLKIKSLLTPKRVVGIIVGIYVVILGSLSLNYSNFKYVWKFDPVQNRSKLGMIFKDNRVIIEQIMYVFNAFYVLVSFTSVIICSMILIWKLNERSRWLDRAISMNQDKNRTQRDRQVIKMVVSVASIFIITFTPSVIMFFVMYTDSDIHTGTKYQDLFTVLLSICFLFDAINCNLNFVVYCKMSSKYAKRVSFLFCCYKDDKG